MKRLVCAVAAGLVAIGIPGLCGHAQPPGDARESKPSYRLRYAGPVELGPDARAAPARVDYRTWTVPEFTKTRLDLPAGQILVELISGKLLTLVGDQQQRRQPGEFWTVPPGEGLTIQTEDDTVMLNTIVLR